LRFLLVEAAQVTARSIPEWRISTCMRCPFTRASKIPRRGHGPRGCAPFALSSRQLLTGRLYGIHTKP
jgi:hypothetical protein